MRSLYKHTAILAICAARVRALLEVELPISARTDEVKSDWTAVVYDGKGPILVSNDGGAASGGFHAFVLNGKNAMSETAHETSGRTKLVATLHGIGRKDIIVTIGQTDSFFRLYDAITFEQIGNPLSRTLGDWSALCGWKSQRSGNQYLFLFGKGQAVQFLIREQQGSMEILEVQTFETPVEASACAVSLSAQSVFFSGDDDPTVYAFGAEESSSTPSIRIHGKGDDDVTGLAVYIGRKSDYLIVAQKDAAAVYDVYFNLLGSFIVTGDEDIEVQGLSFYQGATQHYPAGFLAYAIESETGAGFGVSSLDTAFNALNLEVNTGYSPRGRPCRPQTPICASCNNSGFCEASSRLVGGAACSCFAGFGGSNCSTFSCRNECSGRGKCVGANQCECEEGWGGLYCAFKIVKPVAETEANGGDGDDPAIWISPVDKAESRIITTTKSGIGTGLGIFDLGGSLLQTIAAGEPNNVDVIYGFRAGERTIDLVYAGCRADNTLCLFEMASNGTIRSIAGGIQETKDNYEVYGSCVYRSRVTGKQYLYVNAKSAEYLQFELSWEDDALSTTLVRNFTGGSGGQTEGCVADEANGWILIGEETYGLWRYGAEPNDDSTSGHLISSIDKDMYADVEGVALVEGASADKGFILVSQQGVSAYNVYRRAAPHALVQTFTIYENGDKGIDEVTNTDGIAAVGTTLGSAFRKGLIVVHDDANQLPGGGTSDEASFKLISLEDVIPEGLQDELDPNWDPRADWRQEWDNVL
ncbi:hypothetical protein DL767_000248 [Monosporascus sp. MG133]|nr:hypothetical protein DL767_000248 [Monosporascus sp. MG133]